MATQSLDPISSVLSALKREDIISDVLPITLDLTLIFSVVYPNGKEVLLGNEFLMDETLEEPVISFTPMNIPVDQAQSITGANAEGSAEEPSYTLAMLDPDAPTRQGPIYKSFRHWLVSSSLHQLSDAEQSSGSPDCDR